MYLQLLVKFARQRKPPSLTHTTVPPPGPISPRLHAPPFAQDAFTVNLYVCVGLPDAFLAVTVYVVAPFTTEGLPDNTPVEVLKLIPGGVAEIEKLEIAPPDEITVNPAADPRVTV
jgi:hypothetical protein